MSIAGQRKGLELEGGRSNLFYQAIRIIKEMREKYGKKPRYAVFENVTGALTSNEGYDFESVLRCFVGVRAKEQASAIHRPKDGWDKAGLIMGEDFSIAWRTLDAQYWGVPQRRERVFVVGDFDGYGAGKILFESEGLSGYSAAGFRAWQRATRSPQNSTGAASGYCINPQASSGLTITEEKVNTITAQDHGNHPAVLQSAGFSTEHSAQSRGIGYQEEMSPTLRAEVVPAALTIENHPTDDRIKIREDGVCQTLTERMGTGGNNVPLVGDPITLKMRAGKLGGGKGPLMQQNLSATLGTSQDQTLFQPVIGFDRYNGALIGNLAHTLQAAGGNTVPMVFGISKEAWAGGEKAQFNFAVNEEISPTLQASSPGGVVAFTVCSKSSNSMLHGGPHAGFYQTEVSRTLDTSGGEPTCNQGGTVILESKTYSLQGSMIGREEKNGPQGSGVNEDVSFTLNTTDHHAVATPTYCATTGSFMSVEEEQTPTLTARDYKDPPIVNEATYVIRRLTPIECARLQGFPDWWCKDIAIPYPSEWELLYWQGVWATWGKPKTLKQVKQWLEAPYSDGAEYKLWGNGVALPCVWFIMAGIEWWIQSQIDKKQV